MTNKLATKMQTIGTQLVKEAEKQYTDSQSEKVKAALSRIIKDRENAKTAIIRGNLLLEFLEAQLKAVKDGQFSFHPWTSELQFNEPNLNDPFSWEKNYGK